MILDALSIRNLRSIVEHEPIKVAPLTFVVGANSSGKSTFVRTFPLFRQSVETVTRGPILWFGRFVDFGVFDDAIAKSAKDDCIEFCFDLNIEKNLNPSERSFGFWTLHRISYLNDVRLRVTLIVAKVPSTSNTYTKCIKIEYDNRLIEIEAAPDGNVHTVRLDGVIITSTRVALTINAGASLFSVAVSRKARPLPSEVEVPFRRLPSAFQDLVLLHIATLFHGKTDLDKRVGVVRRLGIGTIQNLLTQLREVAKVTETSATRARTFKADSEWAHKLQGLVLADKIPMLLNEIDGFLSATFRQVSYVGPLRATAERFYRQQDLAVDEVDPQGANLAMFLMGLSESKRAEFSAWCAEKLGFEVEAKTEGAHVSIRLKDSEEGGIYNIADMGFGYSQLLPVLATIWSSTAKMPVRQSPRLLRSGISVEDYSAGQLPKIIVIEQPELHLHPRLQGRLANLLCLIAKQGVESKLNVRIICETHSETIINQVGHLVVKKNIDPDLVQVMVFEKADDQTISLISKATYGNDGVLNNWPYGFFLADHD